MGFTLSASVAFTEILRPLYNQTWIKLNALLFGFFTLACILLAVFYFRNLKSGEAGSSDFVHIT